MKIADLQAVDRTVLCQIAEQDSVTTSGLVVIRKDARTDEALVRSIGPNCTLVAVGNRVILPHYTGTMKSITCSDGAVVVLLETELLGVFK